MIVSSMLRKREVYFFPLARQDSVLIVFFASVKANHVHLVMSLVFFFKGNFLEHSFLLKFFWHLSEELQFATLCTELSVSL